MSDSARKAAEEIAAAFDPIHPTTKAAFVDRMSTIIAKHFPPAPIPAMGEREAFEKWAAQHIERLLKTPIGVDVKTPFGRRMTASFIAAAAWKASRQHAPSPSPSEGLTEVRQGDTRQGLAFTKSELLDALEASQRLALSAESERDALARRMGEIHDKAMTVCRDNHANLAPSARQAYALALHDIAALAQPEPKKEN